MCNLAIRTTAGKALAAITAAFLFFSSAVWAAGPELIGSLRASGVVVTNSIPMPDGGTVKSGDSIATDRGSLAVITSRPIGRLEVRANSQARLASGSVLLERGAVASSRLAVEAGQFTIRPESPGAAWFAVANQGGRVLVAAHRGNVIIAAPGFPQVVVPEGNVAQQDTAQQAGNQQNQDQKKDPGQTQGQPDDQSATAPQTPPDQPTSTKSGNKKKKGGGAAAGAAAAGWTIGSLSHVASIALVAGIGAAAAGTAAGAAVALSESGPSPSQ